MKSTNFELCWNFSLSFKKFCLILLDYYALRKFASVSTIGIIQGDTQTVHLRFFKYTGREGHINRLGDSGGPQRAVAPNVFLNTPFLFIP